MIKNLWLNRYHMWNTCIALQVAFFWGKRQENNSFTAMSFSRQWASWMRLHTGNHSDLALYKSCA